MNTHVKENIPDHFLKPRTGRTGQKFDSSFLTHDATTRRRHGEKWTADERDQLGALFNRGASLATMCVVLQRPAAGVLSKLVQFKYLKHQIYDGTYYYAGDVFFASASQHDGFITTDAGPCVIDIKTDAPDGLLDHQVDMYRYFMASAPTITDSSTAKELTMSTTAKTIETKTFIRGVEASKLTNDQIIQIIAEQEAQLQFLKGLDASTTSAAIQKAIGDIESDIGLMVKLIDER